MLIYRINFTILVIKATVTKLVSIVPVGINFTILVIKPRLVSIVCVLELVLISLY